MNDSPDTTAVLTATAEIVDAHAARAVALAARRRRLLLALADLGLLEIVGHHWCTLADDGFEFTTLTNRQTDTLVCALEDLAQRLPEPPAPQPGPGQLDLF